MEQDMYLMPYEGSTNDLHINKRKYLVSISCYTHLKLCNRNFEYKMGFLITYTELKHNGIMKEVNYLFKSTVHI